VTKGPETTMIRATARLELTGAEMRMLGAYVR
jgi:hypothetical protein